MIFPKIWQIYSRAFVPGEGSSGTNGCFLLKRRQFTGTPDPESIGGTAPVPGNSCSVSSGSETASCLILFQNLRDLITVLYGKKRCGC